LIARYSRTRGELGLLCARGDGWTFKVPEGLLKIARRFNAGNSSPQYSSPEGTVELFGRPFGGCYELSFANREIVGKNAQLPNWI